MLRVSYDTFNHEFHQPFNVIQVMMIHQQRTNVIQVFAIHTISQQLLSNVFPDGYVPNRFLFIVFPGLSIELSKNIVSIFLLFSVHHQMCNIKRQSQPFVRSSSVHDLKHHEVFRANELDFGPIIGQGFYGIARTVTKNSTKTSMVYFISYFVKVTLRKTGQTMVMKETKTIDKEAQKIFVKEVQICY